MAIFANRSVFGKPLFPHQLIRLGEFAVGPSCEIFIFP